MTRRFTWTLPVALAAALATASVPSLAAPERDTYGDSGRDAAYDFERESLDYDTYELEKLVAVAGELDVALLAEAVRKYAPWLDELLADGNTHEVTGDFDGDGEPDSATIEDLDRDDDHSLDEEELDEWRAWRNALYVLLRILLGAEEYAESRGLNGVYDGVLWDGAGHTVVAVVDLVQRSGHVNGALFIDERGLEVDLGWLCPTVDMPVSSWPISATITGTRHANGAFQRDVRIVDIIETTVTGQYWMQLADDYETVHAQIHIDAPTPCTSETFTGRFVRRPGSF